MHETTASQDKAVPARERGNAKTANTAVSTKMVDDDDYADESIIEFEEDIDDAEPPVPIPEREYRARIDKAVRRVSKESQKAYVAVTFLIAPDDLPADIQDAEEGVRLKPYRRVPLGNSAEDRYQRKMFCKALGIPTDTRRLNLNEWKGLECTVVVRHEENFNDPERKDAGVFQVKRLD